jgi:hypothetical protein
MIQRMLKFSRVAAVLFFGLAFGGLALGVAPAAAGGCGWGCGGPAVVAVPVVPVYPACSCCGCGGGYYGAYAPGYAYGYGSAAYGYAAAYAPYAYVNRFYRPRIYVGPRRVWR